MQNHYDYYGVYIRDILNSIDHRNIRIESIIGNQYRQWYNQLKGGY